MSHRMLALVLAAVLGSAPAAVSQQSPEAGLPEPVPVTPVDPAVGPVVPDDPILTTTPLGPATDTTGDTTAPSGSAAPVSTPGGSLPSYLLGPGDQFVILALNAEEISNKPIRVGVSGEVNLPLIGRVEVAGKTVQELEAELAERLGKYVIDPQLAVSVTEYRSQPVSILGAVGRPGVIQLEGRKSLIEVLSQAGGLQANAGSVIMITRELEQGPLPLTDAVVDPTGRFMTAEVNLRAIMDASDPAANIPIMPNDVISVPRAEIVYVMGQVRRPGGFTLSDNEHISVLQALAMANGLVEEAGSDGKIIRPTESGERTEIAIDLRALLEGKAEDVMMQPDDILFVPDSYTRSAFRTTLDAVIRATTGMVIYRRF